MTSSMKDAQSRTILQLVHKVHQRPNWHNFAELMFQGKIKPAMRLLTRHGRGGKLNLDDLVPVSSTAESKELCVTSDTTHVHKLPIQLCMRR